MHLSKFLMHFQDKGIRICFLAHPVGLLIIFAHQNYFYQNFCRKKIFRVTCNKMYLPISNFKVAPPPHLPTWGGGRRLSVFIFTNTDSFLKTIENLFFHFSTQGVFLEIFDQFNLFVTTGICIYFQSRRVKL